MDIKRKLATVRKVTDVLPIPDADKICAYQIDGWVVVDAVNKYKKDDLVLYLECDAWVPTTIAPFLSKDKEPKEYLGIKGERLRSIKLKKQVSQGLLLPISILSTAVDEGYDATDELGVIQWEPPFNAQLAGMQRGNFPPELIKTDAERIQNLGENWWYSLSQHENEVTEKLHGTSCTMYLDMDDIFRVCSRNIDLKFEEENTYWKAALMYDVENKLRKAQMQGIAVQGEVLGSGINNNQYNLQLDFFVFSMFNAKTRQYAPSFNRQQICNSLGLKHVPILNIDTKDKTVKEMLEIAEGKSVLNGSEREGIVIKSQRDQSITKVISNRWLLKND